MADKTVKIHSDGAPNYDYTSLNAALAGEDDINADLTAMAGILTFDLYAFNDTTLATTGSGYTTSSAYYLNIVVNPSYVNYNTAGTSRHSGVWDGSKYNLQAASPVLSLVENYTRVVGLQIDSTGNNGLYFNNVTNLFADKCIVKGCSRTGFASEASSVEIRNCLSYDNGRWGFYNLNVSTGVLTCNNCTAVDNGYDGFASNPGGAGAVNCVNCLAHSNGDGATYFDFRQITGTLTCNNCASSDATADDFGGSGNRASQTFTFLNEAGNDFHLASSDAGAKDYGQTIAGFSDDIDGQTRSGSWDIGADEYVAAAGARPLPTRIFHGPFTGPFRGSLQ